MVWPGRLTSEFPWAAAWLASNVMAILESRWPHVPRVALLRLLLRLLAASLLVSPAAWPHTTWPPALSAQIEGDGGRRGGRFTPFPRFEFALDQASGVLGPRELGPASQTLGHLRCLCRRSWFGARACPRGPETLNTGQGNICRHIRK
jgi:hypothetical protein